MKKIISSIIILILGSLSFSVNTVISNDLKLSKSYIDKNNREIEKVTKEYDYKLTKENLKINDRVNKLILSNYSLQIEYIIYDKDRVFIKSKQKSLNLPLALIGMSTIFEKSIEKAEKKLKKGEKLDNETIKNLMGDSYEIALKETLKNKEYMYNDVYYSLKKDKKGTWQIETDLENLYNSKLSVFGNKNLNIDGILERLSKKQLINDDNKKIDEMSKIISNKNFTKIQRKNMALNIKYTEIKIKDIYVLTNNKVMVRIIAKMPNTKSLKFVSEIMAKEKEFKAREKEYIEKIEKSNLSEAKKQEKKDAYMLENGFEFYEYAVKKQVEANNYEYSQLYVPLEKINGKWEIIQKESE
ncbi:hypothetical protein [Oceanivirga salmonicida]|uniref:hypothetical protein n=1 Tax=Oceanivirga salmonicida TaxID=1769291 RepID=UPI00082CCE00|nr:hypothetical protein [Oceanivirga salmonicida]